MSIEQISVDILNRQFTIGTPESERGTLLEAVELLNQKIHAIQSSGRNMETEKIVIMAALNLTHDLLKRADENGRQQQLSEREFERRIKTLENFCDQALSESKAA